MNHFEAGLSCRAAEHWLGEVTGHSVLVAEEKGRIQGSLVSSIDRERLAGNILSAYVHRNTRGREFADALVTEAYGWTATGIHNPARLIYRSIGYCYWYTCFSRMTKRL